MQIDPKLMQSLRSIAHIGALVLLACGVAELFGMKTPAPGDYWQIMVAAMALKATV